MNEVMTAVVAVIGAVALVAAACSNRARTSGGGTAAPKMYSSIGSGEGALKLIAWNGYTEDGSNDPNYDWVTPFEKQTGCKVSVKYADTSDEMVTLMRQGGGSVYDGVSASGNAIEQADRRRQRRRRSTRRCSREFTNVISPLQPASGTNNSHYVVNGDVYGVPTCTDRTS